MSEMVGMTSRMSGIGREALHYDQEWSEGPPLYQGVVGRPSQMSGCGREVLPEVPE